MSPLVRPLPSECLVDAGTRRKPCSPGPVVSSGAMHNALCRACSVRRTVRALPDSNPCRRACTESWCFRSTSGYADCANGPMCSAAASGGVSSRIVSLRGVGCVTFNESASVALRRVVRCVQARVRIEAEWLQCSCCSLSPPSAAVGIRAGVADRNAGQRTYMYSQENRSNTRSRTTVQQQQTSVSVIHDVCCEGDCRRRGGVLGFAVTPREIGGRGGGWTVAHVSAAVTGGGVCPAGGLVVKQVHGGILLCIRYTQSSLIPPDQRSISRPLNRRHQPRVHACRGCPPPHRVHPTTCVAA